MTMQELTEHAQDWQWYYEAHGENWRTVEWAFEIVNALVATTEEP